MDSVYHNEGGGGAKDSRATGMWYIPAIYHVVWTPKYRYKALVDVAVGRLMSIIQEETAKMNQRNH